MASWDDETTEPRGAVVDFSRLPIEALRLVALYVEGQEECGAWPRRTLLGHLGECVRACGEALSNAGDQTIRHRALVRAAAHALFACRPPEPR